MKSDEEFIAGIYQKAEERKMEEEKTAQNLQNTGRGHNFRAWRTLAAAACLCLIVSGAVYIGSRPGQEEDSPAQQSGLSGENAVMALSLGEPGETAGDAAPGDDVNPRGRIAPGEENGEAPGTEGFWSGENAVAKALRAAGLLAYPKRDENPAWDDERDISSGEDYGEFLPETEGADISSGENDTDTMKAGGN